MDLFVALTLCSVFDGFVCCFDSVQCLMHLFVSLTLCSVCFGVFIALFDTVLSVWWICLLL